MRLNGEVSQQEKYIFHINPTGRVDEAKNNKKIK
jgi:hypothetical protein